MTDQQGQTEAFGAFSKYTFFKRASRPGLPPGYWLPARQGGER